MEPIVSICCITYNQEKYIRNAIESFLMQKTSFPYEIIISDDASTDRTPYIVKEYEKKYPDIIKGIYRTENLYSKGNSLRCFSLELAKGKYIATCEGDDYWSDENKLQQQYECLKKHKDSVMCVHKVRHITEDGKRLKEYRPKSLKTGKYTGEDMLKLIMLKKEHCPFQFSTYFFRQKLVSELVFRTPEFIKIAPIGDIPLMLYLASKGSFFFINSEMSCYRKNSAASWTNGQRKRENKLMHFDSYIQVLRLYNAYTKYKYADIINHYIAENEFQRYKFSNNYPAIKDKKYHGFYKEMKPVKKLRVFLCFKIPWIEKVYFKWKEHLI